MEQSVASFTDQREYQLFFKGDILLCHSRYNEHVRHPHQVVIGTHIVRGETIGGMALKHVDQTIKQTHVA